MNERGYTLLELLIAISISSVLLLAMGDFAANAIAGGNQDYNKTLVLSNAQQAVDVIAREIRYAKSVEANNSQPDNNAPGAPGNLYSWSGTPGNGGNLILAVPAKDSSGNVIYIDAGHTQIYTDDVIYYLDGSSHKLFRRYIKNTVAPGDAATTTCPPASSSPSCPSDADVVDDVANLTTTYYDGNYPPNVITSPSGTEDVQYTVTETKTINRHQLVGTYSTIAALRNK